ncbi:MAG: UDP-N-acetylglucosamine 1-carboxyvinyltransferase [Candidatus Magnetoovum sp. WYHC-5]|nr:UDP-N-acetylglucosamine 1-carboxyvinyltransferase [Candidatus Magnetoovum sp. WYHC-5]
MDKLLIKGGKQLKGEVSISGAKNAALPLMAATILCKGKSVIKNVPKLRDVNTMAEVLKTLGAVVEYNNGILNIDTTVLTEAVAPYELVKTMRASVLTLGPMVARFGHAKVSMPGGCAIGARPINLHLSALEKMGADITLDGGYVIVDCCKVLTGAHILFETVTVTGTENIMMAAVFAEGKTILENAALEPEVVDLANALNSMGAQITGAGTSTIEITGVDELKPLDSHSIIPDRIETGTFMAISAITQGNVLIKRTRVDHIMAIIEKFRQTGVIIEEEPDGIRVIGPEKLTSSNVKTNPFPSFPTDMQAQFMAMMAVSNGTSIIQETIFENRYMHVAELLRMGAKIEIVDTIANVHGVKQLKGAPVMATDLRASASLVVAALVAEGETIIDRIYHLDRGYERIEEKIAALGGDVKRIKYKK